ncbi:hypothetical protein GUJ93_ZPchr0002g24598 [Zizania palustris]|uniref:Uncharacterized protein n=1 Tax=Zizania palustris TaxID=103762 RepID=A0A8J5VAZ1_ZIZPA|nr:hypothetical protein GUJ93_ZPchr0002g24598 [Zizania palustris]
MRETATTSASHPPGPTCRPHHERRGPHPERPNRTAHPPPPPPPPPTPRFPPFHLLVEVSTHGQQIRNRSPASTILPDRLVSQVFPGNNFYHYEIV